jgi:hypothetical protein
MRNVASVPMTITAAANGMKSHEVQPLAAALGAGATGAGPLAVSEDELAEIAGEAAAGTGDLAVSEGVLAVTWGVVAAAACISDRFPGLAASRAE